MVAWSSTLGEPVFIGGGSRGWRLGVCRAAEVGELVFIGSLLLRCGRSVDMLRGLLIPASEVWAGC